MVNLTLPFTENTKFCDENWKLAEMTFIEVCCAFFFFWWKTDRCMQKYTRKNATKYREGIEIYG